MYEGTCFVAPGQEIGAIFLLPDAFFCLASTPSTNQIRVMTCIMTCQIDMIGQQCHVEWPRCIERDARFGAGLEGSFSSFGETSLVVLTLRCQRGNGGETAEWAYGGMTQGARGSLPHSDISPLDGEIHVFPILGTFLWYLTTIIFYIATEYPTKYSVYSVLQILSNILYPIEYFK